MEPVRDTQQIPTPADRDMSPSGMCGCYVLMAVTVVGGSLAFSWARDDFRVLELVIVALVLIVAPLAAGFRLLQAHKRLRVTRARCGLRQLLSRRLRQRTFLFSRARRATLLRPKFMPPALPVAL